MPTVAASTLTVALGSTVKASVHSGVAIAASGHWVVNGRRDRTGVCHGDNPAGCRMLEQAKLLHRFLSAVNQQGFTGSVTALTASRDVATLLDDWRHGHDPRMVWYNGINLGFVRRLINAYANRLTVLTIEPTDGSLLGLAGAVSETAFKGLYALHDRTETEVLVRQQIARAGLATD